MNINKKQEVLKLTYQNGDILYTSIHALHKIAKYSGKEGITPKINQLHANKNKPTALARFGLTCKLVIMQ